MKSGGGSAPGARSHPPLNKKPLSFPGLRPSPPPTIGPVCGPHGSRILVSLLCTPQWQFFNPITVPSLIAIKQRNHKTSIYYA